MEKDLFDYIVVPTKKEYRNYNIVDDIYGMPKLNISSSSLLIKPYEYLVNDAIINYNDEVVVAKTFYTNMRKYQKYFQKRGNKEYDFWARKYGEQTIKELYSIYDKSIHIFNYLFDLRITPGLKFKQKVMKKIEGIDQSYYEKIKKIDEEIYDKVKNNVIRNDITHNMSCFFVRYIPKYEDGESTGWYIEEPLSYDEYKKLIDDICSLLIENKQIIIDKLREMYPKKGTEEYNKKAQIDKIKIEELFNSKKN